MSFFEELKKRKVYRTAAAYAVVAFVIMQIIEIVFPMFGIPDWAGRMVIIILFLGIPITIVFSWMYDVGEKGMVRSKPMMVGEDEDSRGFLARKRSWFLVGGRAGDLIIWSHSHDSGARSSRENRHNSELRRSWVDNRCINVSEHSSRMHSLRKNYVPK